MPHTIGKLWVSSRLAYYKRVRETAREKKGRNSVLDFLPFRKYKEEFWPYTISTPTMSYG